MTTGVRGAGRKALLARFLRWWAGEIKALAPARLRRALALDPPVILAEPDGDGFLLTLQDGEQARKLGEASPTEPVSLQTVGRRVLLRLPADEGLSKTLTLPLAAEENLREVLEFEMERQTPFPAEQVYFDWRIVERRIEDRKLVLRLLVAPRSLVAQALERLERSGLSPHAVDLAGESSLAVSSFNLLPEELRPPVVRPGGERAFIAAAVLLGLAALFSPLLHDWQANRRADGEIALLRIQAEPAARLRAELDRRRGGLDAIAGERHGAPAAVLLEELTRLFPDEAWVNEMSLHGGELEISGLADSAAALVQRIESSQHFRAVDFRTAVTRDPASGRERFNFEIMLAGRGAAK